MCRLGARADRRAAALTFIACRSGPEFLKRCQACDGLWWETLRFETWQTVAEAEEKFGGRL